MRLRWLSSIARLVKQKFFNPPGSPIPGWGVVTPFFLENQNGKLLRRCAHKLRED